MTDLMQSPQLAILAASLAGGLLLVVLALLVALYRASAARQKAEVAAREVKEASVRKFRRLEHDLNFLVDFYRVFARLLAEMHAEKKVRMIPQALLNAMVEIYGPEVAAVLVRRGPSGGNPEEVPRLSVVALHSTRGGSGARAARPPLRRQSRGGPAAVRGCPPFDQGLPAKGHGVPVR